MRSILEQLEGLDPDEWRVAMTRTSTGCRVWRVFHRGESSPRLTLRET